MAAQRLSLARSPRLILFGLFLRLFAPAGTAQPVQAAPAQPMKCPMYSGNGAAHCQEARVTLLSPSPVTLEPSGGGSVTHWRRWSICASTAKFFDIFVGDHSDPGWEHRGWTFLEHIQGTDHNDWDGNWTLWMGYLNPDDTEPWLYGWEPYDVSMDVVMGPKENWPDPPPPCPRPTPPCLTCAPVVSTIALSSSFDFWAYTPELLIDGEAACPARSPAGSWCPPTVGNPVSLWVSGFSNERGQSIGEGSLFNYLGIYSRLDFRLRWVPTGPYVWNFDDAHVNPSSGFGQRTPSVSSSLNQPVSHTFEYSSAYDPIRQCAHPCPGDLKGPPAPGYPNGTPAFQVRVASTWNLELSQRVVLEGRTSNWVTQTVDLRDFGSPTSYFTAVTTLPLFVLSYGSVTP